MATLTRLTPTGRQKEIARSEPMVFIKWLFPAKTYVGIVEVKNNSGERYQVSMTQLEWADLKQRIDDQFTKHAHA